MSTPTQLDVLVVGAGQAGLAAGYYLARAGLSFMIADEADAVGATWRGRWDSLRLFTPASVSALPGLDLDGADRYPTKDAVADYLQHYARRFELPVALSQRVTTVWRQGERLHAAVGSRQVAARHVIAAGGFHRRPRIPADAGGLSSDVIQLTSASYRRPEELPAGTTLIVGAGNSGAEIAVDIADGGARRVILVGRDVGRLPPLGPPVFRVMRHTRTDIAPGRWIAKAASRGGDPLGRTNPRRLPELGVERRYVRFQGVDAGRPVIGGVPLDDVATVVWCTGLDADLSWLGASLGRDPAIHTLGRPFQSTMASHPIGGVGADAARVVARIRRCPRPLGG